VVVVMESGRNRYGSPEDPSSAGWTEAKRMRLFSEAGPFVTEFGGRLLGGAVG